MYWLFNAHVGIPSDYYYYQTTNNFKKLIGQEDVEIISPIIILILLAIRMHVQPTEFLENSTLNVEFDIDRIIREKFVVV